MFAPNSIRSLLSKKNLNQLENPEQSPNNSSTRKTPENSNQENPELNDILSKSCRDVTDKVINTRILLKEIDYKINDLQRWRDERKKDLEEKLLQNKKMASLEFGKPEPTVQEDQNYEKYIEKLQEMMQLYATGLRESMKQSTTKGRDYENIMRDIEQQLAEKEAKLAELDIQLASAQNIDDKMGKETYKLNLDFEKLKESLESWKADFNESLRKAHKSEANKYASKTEPTTEDSDLKSIKELIEKEKKNTQEVQRYDFKNDLDEIDNELRELEELMGSK